MIIGAGDTFGATQAAREEYRMGRVGREPRDAILDHVTLWGQVEEREGGGRGGGEDVQTPASCPISVIYTPVVVRASSYMYGIFIFPF